MNSALASSASRRRRAPPWWSWREPIPAIVAEALAPAGDPLLSALRPGPPAAPAAVARAMVTALAPPADSRPAPGWLTPSQRHSFGRVLSALANHGGALLADPVGSGKTFVALAVATAWNGTDPTTCLVPAALVPQWRRVAADLRVAVVLHSLERVSRGVLPPRSRGLVIIDESHRLRNPSTRRYGHLASWLVGRPVLLLSATPAVNRADDLVHQLLLVTRDDTLSRFGVRSLAQILREGRVHPALGRLIVTGSETDQLRPSRIEQAAPAGARGPKWLPPILAGLDEIRLSSSVPIAALIRMVCWRAAASSPAALLGSLRRYRRLLLQARDALACDRPLTRAQLRRFTAGTDEQLVLWQLLPSAPTVSDLALEDLPAVERLIELMRPNSERTDAKAQALEALLGDGRRTLVFVAYRETVRYLRGLLGEGRIAWCTGATAGIGRTQIPRELVLGWFRPGSSGLGMAATGGRGIAAPLHLITTDVTAEGLDLQAAERVVHYDLPWNQVRLDQRNGRAIRRGSPHTAVEVVRFDPPPSLEERLASGARLARKAALPPAWGLGAGGRRVWRWREEVKAALGEGPAVRGVATIEGPEAGLLAGFVLSRPDDLGACDAIVSVGWLSRTREWSEDAAVVEPRLLEAARAIQIQAVDTGEIGRALEAILPLVRQRLRDAHTGCWHRERPSLSARHLLRRLTSWASIAIRERDGQALSRIEGAMRFVAAGHSVGEERLIERLAALPDIEARRQLPTLPEPAPEWGALEPRLLGMVVFRVGESGRLTVSS